MNTQEYQQLHIQFKTLLSDFSDVYEKVTTEGDWKNSFRDIIAKDIPQLLKKCADIQSPYITVGSYGKGRWTAVPWIAVFDSRITTSAQKGVYIVYLVNKDSKELYLTFEVATTEVMGSRTDSKGNTVFSGVVGKNDPKMQQALKTHVEEIRRDIPNDYFTADEAINTGSSGYDYGAVYYKKYGLDDLPDGEVLVEDLKAMLDVYRAYYEKTYAEESQEWWPSSEDYSPGISKEQWVKILNNPDMIGPVWGGVLAMFYDYGGAATCSQIGMKYGFSAMSISGRCTQLAKAIHKHTNCKLYDGGDDRTRYWPILFQGKDAKAEEKGTFVWNLRPELKEALSEVDIEKYLVGINETGERETVQVSAKEAITRIKAYISSKGFSYNEGLIENFYLSLKSKPFVILAGTSGTGKTRLVKLFAEAIGADYFPIPVRPDWSDGSDLFGHNDLNGNFIEGPVCPAFKAAAESPVKPVLLCLDEMNLARVEYYLSDFLSVIESREKSDDGSIRTDQIAQFEDGIPDNLYIVGTVNMDETTFPFSKKVLDRANTIEFSYVDLEPTFEAVNDTEDPVMLSNKYLRAEYLVLSRDCANERNYVLEVCSDLKKINEILVKANLHVGYRVRDEIVFYMLNNKKAEDLLSPDRALDNEIMQKILPRVQGSATMIRDMLVELYKFCMGDYSGLDIESGQVGKKMQDLASNAKYTESAKKIAYMMTRFEEDGFTSYWL